MHGGHDSCTHSSSVLDGTFHVEVEPALMKELKVALHCRDIDSAISVIREVNVSTCQYSTLHSITFDFTDSG